MIEVKYQRLSEYSEENQPVSQLGRAFISAKLLTAHAHLPYTSLERYRFPNLFRANA
jgi:hypothetical protein